MAQLYENRSDAQDATNLKNTESGGNYQVVRCRHCKLYVMATRRSNSAIMEVCNFCVQTPFRVTNPTDLPWEQWKQQFVQKHEVKCYYCGNKTTSGPLCDGHKHDNPYGARFLRDLNQGKVK